MGWQFNVINAITIDGLGMWDAGADGLGVGGPEPIGLSTWTPAETLLASVTVTDGSTRVASAASAYGVWLFADIAPLTLQPGSYVIGAFFSKTVPVDQNSGPYTAIADIEFVDGVFSFPDSGFSFPAICLVEPAFGPTMRPSTIGATVPEPGTLALFSLGLSAPAATRRRKQQPSIHDDRPRFGRERGLCR